MIRISDLCRSTDEKKWWEANGLMPSGKINYLMMILTNASGEDYHLVFQAPEKKTERNLRFSPKRTDKL